MNDEQRLIDEIVDRQIELKRLRLAKALPVERLIIDTEKSIPTGMRWAIAAITLVVALIGIFCTDPWSRGAAHYVREGIFLVFGFLYVFGGGMPIVAPALSACEALAASPRKLEELPRFIAFILPACISIGSVVAFYVDYYN